MLSYKQANVPTAVAAAQAARRLCASAPARERAHVDALDAWIAGDLDRTLAVWEAILADEPRDILAFRLAHFNYFWLGRPREMRGSVERILPKWARDLLPATALLVPVLRERRVRRLRDRRARRLERARKSTTAIFGARMRLLT